MKVLMFGWEFPPYISGGLGTACYGLTKSLSELGHQITFVLPKIKGSATTAHLRVLGADRLSLKHLKNYSWKWTDNLKWIEISSTLRPYLTETSYRDHLEVLEKTLENVTTSSSLLDSFSGDYGKDLVTEVLRYAAVGEALALVESYDVIHAHDWMTFLAGVRAKAVSKRPLVVHVHSTEFDRSGEHVNQDIYDIERYGMDQADRIIAVSGRTRDIIIQRFGQPTEKVRVVHNAVTKEPAVDKKSVPRPLKEKIVLFLGRVTMQKGPDYFVEAAAEVLKKVKDARFVMAGVGDMLPRIIERAAALRIQNRFHFTGFLRGAERERIFALCDVYVMPSVSEPFGITPYEVMKYRVPIIVSRQSGITEVLEHVLKVDFWDVHKLAASISNVLQNENLSRELVERSTEELDRVDWVHSARKVEQLYGTVASA